MAIPPSSFEASGILFKIMDDGRTLEALSLIHDDQNCERTLEMCECMASKQYRMHYSRLMDRHDLIIEMFKDLENEIEKLKR